MDIVDVIKGRQSRLERESKFYYAFKCHTCNSVFLIHMKDMGHTPGSCPCPVCESQCGYLSSHISLPRYKLIKWWRENVRR